MKTKSLEQRHTFNFYFNNNLLKHLCEKQQGDSHLFLYTPRTGTYVLTMPGTVREVGERKKESFSANFVNIVQLKLLLKFAKSCLIFIANCFACVNTRKNEE